MWITFLVKMRVLVLSFYYPPDIGPASLRAKSFVDALVNEGQTDLEIDVITSMPNRYHSLKIPALNFEKFNKVSITRVSLPSHKSGMFDQAKAFVSFSFKVLKITNAKKWDIVFVTSSRLMTASLGALISKRTRSKLYLDIRDLFVDTMRDILKKNFLLFLIPIFQYLEKWTFSLADKVNLVSGGFLDYFKKINPKIKPSTFSNGTDELFKMKNSVNNNNKPIVLYAGNIGEGQGLHKIIPIIASQMKNISFRIIGDGSALELLKNNKILKSLTNVKILKPVLRKELILEYQKADILFLHLNNLKAFQKVLPSKIFEYAATGKPILAGVSGYAADFLNKQVDGVEIFNPCDEVGMKLGLNKLLNGPKIINRSDFCLRFARTKIMEKLAKDVISLF